MEANDIQFISVENQNQDFPKHFHETFCISLIRKGIEKIELNDTFLYSHSDTISITNPFELHANPLVDKDINVSFDTLYISADLMASVSERKNIHFADRQIHDTKINTLFVQLLHHLKSGTIYETELQLKAFIRTITAYSQKLDVPIPDSFGSEYLKELVAYIENNLEDKIYLDELAKIVHINKFGFTRKFKSATGMTPMSYVLMKKIFSAKNQILSDSDIGEVARIYNFTDTAHFSHVFKRYVGISPREYKNQLAV